MKIIRYQDTTGNIGCASMQADGSALKLEGTPYHGSRATTANADVSRLLAPIEPTSIICIGLNYRKHAEETGAKFPEYPVVFFKGINTL